MTHLHLDHVLGLPDLPKATPVYSGPGDAAERGAQNALMQWLFNDLLSGFGPVRELSFAADPDQRFAGILDLFEDGSVWAIASPGHTQGSTSYLVRTPTGPVLLTGDACHTRYGWAHDIEPGTFSSDQPESNKSLAALRSLAARHPTIDVRLGHQR